MAEHKKELDTNSEPSEHDKSPFRFARHPDKLVRSVSKRLSFTHQKGLNHTTSEQEPPLDSTEPASDTDLDPLFDANEEDHSMAHAGETSFSSVHTADSNDFHMDESATKETAPLEPIEEISTAPSQLRLEIESKSDAGSEHSNQIEQDRDHLSTASGSAVFDVSSESSPSAASPKDLDETVRLDMEHFLADPDIEEDLHFGSGLRLIPPSNAAVPMVTMEPNDAPEPVYHWYWSLIDSPEFKTGSTVFVTVGAVAIALATLAPGLLGAAASAVLIGGAAATGVGLVGLALPAFSHRFFQPNAGNLIQPLNEEYGLPANP